MQLEEVVMPLFEGLIIENQDSNYKPKLSLIGAAYRNERKAAKNFSSNLTADCRRRTHFAGYLRKARIFSNSLEGFLVFLYYDPLVNFTNLFHNSLQLKKSKCRRR